MAKIRIPCLVGKTNKGGITSWYWQPSKTLADAGWRPISLGKDMASAMQQAQIRNAEVEQWKLGDQRPAGVARKDPAGTFGALIQRFRREHVNGKRPNGGERLSPRSRETYEVALKRLETWAGKHPVAFITPSRVRVLRDANVKPPAEGGIGHSATFNVLRVLRVVMQFAENHEIIPKGSNPATRFDLAAPDARSTIWEAEDDAAFKAAAYELGLPSMVLAFDLALYTAQREADLIAMTEPQIQELDIRAESVRQKFVGKHDNVVGWVFIQGKSRGKTPMAIPFEPEIRERVETAVRVNRAKDRAAEPKRLLTHVLVNDRSGEPWRKRHFIKTWTQILDKAAKMTERPHMRDLVWHDLRRTRVVRLRRRGMPKEMIASITGHSMASINMMLKVYGPIDPTITAAALADSLDVPAPIEEKTEEKSA